MDRHRILGLDIGMKTDNSALVSVSREHGKPTVDYIHKWKLGTPLLSVVSDVLIIMDKLTPRAILIDATMNQSIYEEIKKSGHWCRIIPITITGGRTQNKNKFGGYNVSKIRMIHTLIKTVERRQIIIPQSAKDLHDELRVFQSILSKAGNPKFEATTGKHDDLVMALAMAVWFTNDKCTSTNEYTGSFCNDNGGEGVDSYDHD